MAQLQLEFSVISVNVAVQFARLKQWLASFVSLGVPEESTGCVVPLPERASVPAACT